MSHIAELMDTISEIIDMKCEYKIVRQDIDEEFAEAHGITLQHIKDGIYIPCMECGQDIIPRILLNPKKGGKQIVFCSKECRSAAGVFRMTKIDDTTNVRQLAMDCVKRSLTIVRRESPADVKKRTTPLVTRKLLAENNRLLTLILEELRGARKA